MCHIAPKHGASQHRCLNNNFNSQNTQCWKTTNMTMTMISTATTENHNNDIDNENINNDGVNKNDNTKHQWHDDVYKGNITVIMSAIKKSVIGWT